MIDLNGTLLFQFLNFFVLVAILAKFAYKPILKTLEDRRNKIASDLNNAQAARDAAEKMKADYQEQIKNAHADPGVIDKAVKQAIKKPSAAGFCPGQITREKEVAQAEIINERESAIREMRNEVVTLSMAVAEKLLKNNINTDRNEKLVHDCIAKLDMQKVTGR